MLIMAVRKNEQGKEEEGTLVFYRLAKEGFIKKVP